MSDPTNGAGYDPTGLPYVWVIAPDGERSVALESELARLGAEGYVREDDLPVPPPQPGSIAAILAAIAGLRGEDEADAMCVNANSLGVSTSGGSTPWPTQVGTDLTVPVTNASKAGTSTTEIMVRQGGVDLIVTVAGGTLPSSGTVSCTVALALTRQPTAAVWRPLVLSFTGVVDIPSGLVPVVVSHDAGGSADPTDPDSAAGPVAWTVGQTGGGPPVAVPPGSVFHCTELDGRRGDIGVFWPAANNPSADPTLAIALRDQDLGFAHLIEPSRSLLIGEHLRSIDTFQVPIKRWWNALWRDRLGTRYVPVPEVLSTYGIVLAGRNATVADNTAMTQGKVPPSLMYDNTHFNPDGFDVVHQLVTQHACLSGLLPGLYPARPTTAVAAAPVATAITGSGFTATWVAVAGATAYHLQIRKPGTSLWIEGPNTKGLSVAATDLDPGTAYEHRTVPYNIAGPGVPSDIGAVETSGTPPVVDCSDTFSGASKADGMTGRMTDNGLGGEVVRPWIVDTTFGGIDDGASYLSHGNSVRPRVDRGVTFGAVEIEILALPSSGALEAQLRMTNGLDGYRVLVGANGNLRVNRKAAGVAAVTITPAPVPGVVVAPCRLKFTIDSGGHMVVKINGNRALTVDDAVITTGTQFGYALPPGARIGEIVFSDQ